MRQVGDRLDVTVTVDRPGDSSGLIVLTGPAGSVNIAITARAVDPKAEAPTEDEGPPAAPASATSATDRAAEAIARAVEAGRAAGKAAEAGRAAGKAAEVVGPSAPAGSERASADLRDPGRPAREPAPESAGTRMRQAGAPHPAARWRDWTAAGWFAASVLFVLSLLLPYDGDHMIAKEIGSDPLAALDTLLVVAITASPVVAAAALRRPRPTWWGMAAGLSAAAILLAFAVVGVVLSTRWPGVRSSPGSASRLVWSLCRPRRARCGFAGWHAPSP